MHKDTLFSTLRTLDAAPRRTADEASRRRAEARLEQILATNPSGTPAAPPRVSPLRATPKTRWSVLGAVAVIAIGALVIVPTVTRPDPAYASWTPVPTTLTEAERTIAITPASTRTAVWSRPHLCSRSVAENGSASSSTAR
jgi:hypothetical protein